MGENKKDIKIRNDEFIGENLYRLRIASGLKQDDVVAKMQLLGSKISRTGYSKMERGARHIKCQEIIMLHFIFNVGYEEFFRGKDERNISSMFAELPRKC